VRALWRVDKPGLILHRLLIENRGVGEQQNGSNENQEGLAGFLRRLGEGRRELGETIGSVQGLGSSMVQHSGRGVLWGCEKIDEGAYLATLEPRPVLLTFQPGHKRGIIKKDPAARYLVRC